MPSNVQIKFKKKDYNSSSDSGDGIVVFDNNTSQIFVGGECFSSNVKDASYNSSTKILTITRADGTTVQTDLSGFEVSSNKVTSLSASSTDTQYPSAKCVYDLIGPIDDALDAILNG